MYQIRFDHPVNVHFIGIGGISMSGLAALLLDRGFRVSGSDIHASALTNQLETEGACIRIGQTAENIPSDCDLVVYTAAVHPDNPEYREALSRGIAMLTRAELLGEIMDNYPLSVAVSGTHGKTTTTSMLSHMTMASDMDPTISVGGMLPSIGGNIRIGSSGSFITEACEYTNSFLSLYPKVGLILNIDADHLDFFKDLDDIRHSFRRFAQQILPDGALVINSQIPDLQEITDGLSCRIITFGTPDSDYSASDIIPDDHGTAFTVNVKGGAPDRFRICVPGEHNIQNALAAIAAADFIGVPRDKMKDGLLTFFGTDRRFQKKGTLDGVTIIDDYAHHPTEIRATLRAAKTVAGREIWCVFQPHTYSRTRSLLDEFAQALTLADHVVIAEIYAARETDTLGMSGALLSDRIAALGTDSHFFPDFASIESYLRENTQPEDLLITMGAGDIYKVGEDLLR